jgi:hypothetical protein
VTVVALILFFLFFLSWFEHILKEANVGTEMEAYFDKVLDVMICGACESFSPSV